MTDKDHFRYASLAEDGLHSGSGVTEGACKFLIAARAKRSGQRWTKKGITAVLALRSLLASERLPQFWASSRLATKLPARAPPDDMCITHGYRPPGPRSQLKQVRGD